VNDSPFDFMNSVTHTKVNLMRDEGRSVSDYAPYLTNRGLSQFADTVIQANMMNTRWHLDKQMQYEYHLHSIRPRKRMGKWAKKPDTELVQTIVDLFGCSVKKAEEIKDVLGSRTISQILKRGDGIRGGVQNTK
jgi:hypothetical protein